MDPITPLAVAKVASTAASTAKATQELGNVIEKYKGIFNKYKPDITNIRIDYRDCSALIDLHISLANNKGWRTKIEIPYGSDFSIINTYAGLYRPISGNWKISNGKYILKGSQIPKDCEDLLVTVKGKVDRRVLDSFVNTRRSTDPFDNGNTDSYWVCSEISNINTLEKMYDRFQLDNVSVDVRVIVRSCFTTSIPHNLRIILSASSDLIKATKTGDKNTIKKANYRLKKLPQWAPVEPQDIYKVIADLIAKKSFENYVSTDGDFGLGRILQDEERISPIPDTIEVDAFTDLNYENDFAEGHVTFNREDYKESIRKKMEKLLD